MRENLFLNIIIYLLINCSIIIMENQGKIMPVENEDIKTNLIFNNESFVDDENMANKYNKPNISTVTSLMITKSTTTMTTAAATLPETDRIAYDLQTTPTTTTTTTKTSAATITATSVTTLATLFQLTNITLLPNSYNTNNNNTTIFNNITSSASKLISADNLNNRKNLPKIQRTDAPMLNYIFDSMSSANKHHHHDHRYGPHFEDISSVGNVTNITAQVGSSVYLNCRISLLQDKTVSWVRRKSGENGLDLLTVGMNTYSGDTRYKMEFQYPNNWRLKIESIIKNDEGIYECQISTYPPRVIIKNLFVNDPKVIIINEAGGPLQDKYYEVDSTMQLSCIVRHVAMTTSVVYWSHGEQILNYDINRGGVSVKTEVMEKGANSTLFIAKINKSDSGNYTCSINSSHEFTVLVHVLNGESFAELHHGSNSEQIFSISMIKLFLLIIGFYSFLNDFINR